MSSISQNNSNEVALLDCVQKFFIKHHVGRLLKQCNGTKEKGVSAVSLLKYKMGNIFTGRSMYMQQKTGSFKEAFSKNTFYRFLNSTKTNWLRFTSLLAADIVKNDLKHLTDDSRKNVFIIDDSLFHRTSCKKTELGSKVFDHTGMNYKKGFRMLTVSWSDGNTLIPVNSCLLASSKESNIIGPVKAFDKRTLAGKRRKLAQTKAPEAMLTLLDTAVSAGLSAEYVLFDSWFSNPAQITALKSRGMDVIAMIKKSSRINYMENMKLMQVRTAGTTANASLAMPTEKQEQQIKNLEYVKTVGTQYMVGSVAEKNDEGRDLSIALSYYDPTEWEKHYKETIKDIEGKYPSDENEIMLSEDALSQLGMKEPNSTNILWNRLSKSTVLKM